VMEAFECAKEEIEHAKYCFTLASYYSGSQVEPDVYESHQVTINPDIKSIVEGTIQDGCIEETISALKAAKDYYEENDPFVKEIYHNITLDEAHHAAYAWKIFKWH